MLAGLVRDCTAKPNVLAVGKGSAPEMHALPKGGHGVFTNQTS